ncbi:hypothetical protein [Vibrio alginolyticus]|uniref:hypothetical protein n=1 Tax=Vibrio alginolyticus TaxID=663 RepID=UPI00375476FF
MRQSLTVLSFCLFPLIANANGEVWGTINEWSRVGFSQTYVTFPDKNTKSFQAIITDDPTGKQIVEIRYYDSKKDVCSYQKIDKMSDAIIKINSKRVKMNVGCIDVQSLKILRYYAKTDKGRDHIVNSFKSGYPINLGMQGYNFNILSEGFEIAWDNYGGDAI